MVPLVRLHYVCARQSLLASIALLCFCSLSSVQAAFTVQPFHSAFPSIGNEKFSRLPKKNLAAQRQRVYTTIALQMGLSREDQIRQKIERLKRKGKINNTPSVPQEGSTKKSAPTVAEQYGDKLKQKLGARKARMMSTAVGKDMSDDEDEDEALLAELDSDEIKETARPQRVARLGSLPMEEEDEDENRSTYQKPTNEEKEYKNFDASLFDDIDDDEEDDLSEQELVELVAEKLAEKREKKKQEEEAQAADKLEQRLESLKQEREELKRQEESMISEGLATSGIGGRWIKSNETANADYKPKVGTWGVFERPKDISKTFGGGKRIGAGYTPDVLSKKESEVSTRDRLKQYREKVGIDVQSERDHASEIQEALEIGKRAMQRGIYGTAVSALEKVTKYCSTNSPVGGEVFLELAMAYEANGRTQEAIAVYSALTKSRMETIKFNAKRLLYGIEAMQFMQNEAKNKEFSRKKIRNTFIETTGLENFASNFDDVYNTAYIDLDRGFYRSLSENVVRSNREARQVLLKAKGAGEVERLKVVQALRSISRHFDEALEEEIKKKKPLPEPVAVMDGKPILVQPENDEVQKVMGEIDKFVLVDAEQMLENLDGTWRLQLLADKRGDGVKYFNTTMSWQKFDTAAGTFSSSGNAAFIKVDQSGSFDLQRKRRILTRTDVSVSGTGGMLSGFLAKGSGGVAGAVSTPHQIVLVDSVLLITRMAPSLKQRSYDDSTKEYFAVWRRAEPGSFKISANLP